MSEKITRSLSSYGEEHRKFLEAKVQGRSYSATVVLFNKKFRTNVTHKTIRSLCRRFGFSNGKPNSQPYSGEEINFLRENAAGMNYSDLAEMFNERFGTNKTALQLGELCRQKGFSNGLDSRFKENHAVNLGRKRADAAPDGTETITAEGYVVIKHDGMWRYKHIFLWEQAHGKPVPTGHHVVFGDGNKRNFDLANLFCITATQNAIRTRNRLHGTTPELAAMGIAMAKLYSQINDRKKKKSANDA
ncbi:MAG: HNH endonuclease [Defluviitaleaceae bacterium]|nr:HNH endonuclease [Defluviitaleaceae bacterium]MCL2263255.1 HNH endonuclease [Defluviitaleaceae bacterium]